LGLGFDQFFRFVGMLGEALRLRPKPEPVERREVVGAFHDLRIAIDRLERVIGRLVEPAAGNSALAPEGGAAGSCVQGVSDQDVPNAGLPSKAEGGRTESDEG